jgi:hypothetical protein
MSSQKRLQKISTAISLVGLALGFSVLGLLIIAKEQDGGASITAGILGILLGAAFLIAACLRALPQQIGTRSATLSTSLAFNESRGRSQWELDRNECNCGCDTRIEEFN